MNRVATCRTLSILGLVGLLVSCGGSSGETRPPELATPPDGPAVRRVITWSELENGFTGTFNIPASAEPGTEHRFGYSNGVHGQLANGNLLVMGHPWYPMQAEVRLPAIFDGGVAERVGAWFDVTGGKLPTGWTDGAPAYVLGGLLQIGDRIHFSKHQWYNGAGDDWETQGYREGETVRGMWRVGGLHAHQSRVGGYLSNAPAALRSDGYTYVAGLEGTSGAALGRWGPNLFAVRADSSAPEGGDWASRPLICHEQESHAPVGWWIGDKVSGAVWIETERSHAVLFFLHQKLGDTWYGEAAEGGDPYGGGKGYHAGGYTLKAWIYDPSEVMAAYRGERDPWSLAPVEEVLLTERRPGSTDETQRSLFTGTAIDELQVSVRGGRMIVLQPGGYRPGPYEGMPKGYVFEIP